MAFDNKKPELEKYKSILLATIDYYLEKHAGSIVRDGFDSIADHYLNQKQKAELDYLNGNLDNLKQEFQSKTTSLIRRGDLDFDKYIKEKTGYEINLLEDLELRVNQIIKQKEIKNQNEHADVAATLSFSKQKPTVQEQIDVLNNLLHNFDDERTIPVQLKIVISNEKPPGVYSPDNKVWFYISESGTDKDSFLTSIAVGFETASGGIYAVKGVNLAVNAYWKNNSTIVVNTKKNYEVIDKCKQIQSFKSTIDIEYMEN